MKERLENLENIINDKISMVNSMKELQDVKNEYFSKKGEISNLAASLSTMSIEDKKVYGKIINDFKNKMNTLLEDKRSYLETKELQEKFNMVSTQMVLVNKDMKTDTAEQTKIDTVKQKFINGL